MSGAASKKTRPAGPPASAGGLVQVRMNVTTASDRWLFAAGEVATVPAEQAAAWIESGQASPVQGTRAENRTKRG